MQVLESRMQKKKSKVAKFASEKFVVFLSGLPGRIVYIRESISRSHFLSLSLNLWIRVVRWIIKCFGRFVIYNGEGILSLFFSMGGPLGPRITTSGDNDGDVAMNVLRERRRQWVSHVLARWNRGATSRNARHRSLAHYHVNGTSAIITSTITVNVITTLTTDIIRSLFISDWSNVREKNVTEKISINISLSKSTIFSIISPQFSKKLSFLLRHNNFSFQFFNAEIRFRLGNYSIMSQFWNLRLKLQKGLYYYNVFYHVTAIL